jgi:hypothetical protein
MRQVRYSISTAAIAVLLSASPCAFGGGWIKIFDGKSLKGWKVHSGFAKYTAEKGAIVGTAVLKSPNSFLCTQREFADFVLEFEVKVGPELNSGVQFRSQIAGEGGQTFPDLKDAKGQPRKIPADRVYGYQAEIAISNAGNVYDEARRGKFLDDTKGRPQAAKAFKVNEWNKYRIQCKGDSIQTWVNGILVADFKDSMTKKGIIGLQVHQLPDAKFKPYQVEWRKLRIKEI